MKTDLTTLGDASWWVTPVSEEKIAEPYPGGYIQTVDVDNYSRQCLLFIAAGRPRPKLGKKARVNITNGRVVFPARKHSTR